MKKELSKLIKDYANVYQRFEKFQKRGDNILGGGDQKTGVIAEYYAKCYIEHTVKKIKSIKYAKPGHPHDLVYITNNNKTIKVQVKGVSAHSKTRTIAPLNLIDKQGKKAFDKLFLIALDFDFMPCGFWINTYEAVFKAANEKTRLQGTIMRGKNTHKCFEGSNHFNFKVDKCKKLLEVLLE